MPRKTTGKIVCSPATSRTPPEPMVFRNYHATALNFISGELGFFASASWRYKNPSAEKCDFELGGETPGSEKTVRRSITWCFKQV